jgi:hypothetical protein
VAVVTAAFEEEVAAEEDSTLFCDAIHHSRNKWCVRLMIQGVFLNWNLFNANMKMKEAPYL